jgi:predicted metal-dependent hydrolase
VFEHCKRLERDLPSSSRCIANFQKVLKAIDKQDRELVDTLDREQQLLELHAEYDKQAKQQLKELLIVHKRVFQCRPAERQLQELARACQPPDVGLTSDRP